MKKITVFGGDSRLRTVFYSLKDNGFIVDSIGLFDDDEAVLESSDVFLLPVPTTKDGKTVYCPLTGRRILLNDIIRIAGDRMVICGNYTPNCTRFTDYCKENSYALLNAVPTAEGAISEAIRITPFTLWNARVLVIGYGRVGKVLAERLAALKCDLTVSARNSTDFALLQAFGIKHINTAVVGDLCDGFDIIFNTIDIPVLNGSIEKLKNTTVIDLSSKGCLDQNKAEALNINYRILPGLPGKTAHDTAGKILSDTVLEILNQFT